MNPYVKITGRTFTMWLLASSINGVLCGISLSIIHQTFLEIAWEIFGIFFISLFFAAPGFFAFWLVLILKFAGYTSERALFRSALIAGFIIASITALFGSKMVSSEFSGHSSIPAACIILSGMSSIMLHFRHFKKLK